MKPLHHLLGLAAVALSTLPALSCASDDDPATRTAASTPVCACQAPLPAPPTPPGPVSWVRGGDLLPGWGVYQAGAAVGVSPNLSDPLPYGTTRGELTWVAHFPTSTSYELRVRARRLCCVEPDLTVALDDADLPPPSLLGDGWHSLGVHPISAGIHHLDLTLRNATILDAVLFTSAPLAVTDPLPPAINDTGAGRVPATTRYPRLYRRGPSVEPFIMSGRLEPLGEDATDWTPASGVPAYGAWGAPGQTVFTTLAFAKPSAKPEVVRIEAADLTDLKGTGTIPASAIDVRVGLWRRDPATLHGTSNLRPAPHLLVKSDLTCPPRADGVCSFDAPVAPDGPQGDFQGGVPARTTMVRGDERLVWVTVAIPPGTPPGLYRGKLTLSSDTFVGRVRSAELSVEVRAIELGTASGMNGVFYPVCPLGVVTPAQCDGATWRAASAVLADYADQARHGLDASFLPGWFHMLHLPEAANLRPFAVMAGDGDWTLPLADARARGFEVTKWICDEPPCALSYDFINTLLDTYHGWSPPFRGAATINNHDAWLALRDRLDHPILSALVFGAEAPAYLAALPPIPGLVRRPLAYWTAEVTYPLYHRGLAGLFLRSLGYQGIFPNAYWQEQHNHFTWPDRDGLPIPTRSWEALRDGLDDVRYLDALDRVTGCLRAELGGAPSPLLDYSDRVRATYYTGLAAHARAHWYLLQLDPVFIDEGRAQMAKVVETLSGALTRRCP